MRHDSYLPASPATLQALYRMEYAIANIIAPPDVRIVGPHFNAASDDDAFYLFLQKQNLALEPYTLPRVLPPYKEETHM